MMQKSTVGHNRNVTTEYIPSVNLRCYVWLFQAKLRKIVSRDLMLLLSLFDVVWSNYIFNSKCVGEIHAGKKSAPGHQTDLTRVSAESDLLTTYPPKLAVLYRISSAQHQIT